MTKNGNQVSNHKNLFGATLKGENLSYACLQCALLKNANLRDANLEGSCLDCACLEGANLEGANLKRASLRGASFNKETRFPDGFDPIARGMILVEEEEKAPPSPPSPNNQEGVVAAVPAAAVLPKTLQEELSELLAKHGFDLTYFGRIPGKNEESVAHFARVVPAKAEGNPLT